MSVDRRESWLELWNLDAGVPEACEVLGDAGPTSRAGEKLVKGHIQTDDGTEKVYYDPAQLRNIARGMTAIADWLERHST